MLKHFTEKNLRRRKRKKEPEEGIRRIPERLVKIRAHAAQHAVSRAMIQPNISAHAAQHWMDFERLRYQYKQDDSSEERRSTG